MSRKKRTYRSALVVTVVMSAGASCGGTAQNDDSSTGGHATGGASTGGQATGGQATGGSTDVRHCEAEERSVSATCEAGDECLVDTDCTSGTTRTMLLRCSDAERWQLTETPCENPSEECRATPGQMRCDGESWHYFGGGGNPPAPCPLERPEEQSTCRFGYGFGADPPACGYPCPDDGWTIVGCEGDEGSSEVPADGHWQSDGACSLGGAGGDAP